MAVFRPVSRNIATTPQSSQDYLAMIEELSRLRRPTDVAMGFGTDRTPMAFALPQARGVSQVTPGSMLQTPMTPTTAIQPMFQTQAQPMQPMQPMQPIQPSADMRKPRSVDVIEKIIQVSEPQVVNRDRDGNTYYSNNTVKDVTGITYDLNTGEVIDVEPEIIGSLGDGLILTRDGQVFKNITSGFTPTGQASRDIQSLLFEGNQYQITQGYGNYNPNAYYTYHRGLDIAGAGEWKVPISLPFEVQVVGKLIDGVNDQGYGNSLLVQLPSGERLRLSHLSQSNFNIGDRIRPGQTLGITGTTGKSTGYHLDLEYYDENGQVQDPYNFVNKIAQNPQQYQIRNRVAVDYAQLTPDQRSEAFYWKASNNKVTEQDRQLYPNEVQQAETRLQETNQAVLGRQDRRDRGVDRQRQETRQEIRQITQPLSERVARFGRERNLPELGVSELLSGDVTGATRNLTGQVGEGIASVGRRINAPELGVSELVSGDVLGAARAVDAPELGISERLSEEIPAFIARGTQFATNIINSLRPQAQADVADLTTRGLNIKSSLDEARGMLSGVGTLQPGNLGRTSLTQAPGISENEFNQPTNPINNTIARPIGQEGFAGNVLMSGITARTNVPEQEKEVTQEEKKVQNAYSPQRTLYGTSVQTPQSSQRTFTTSTSSRSSTPSRSSKSSTSKTPAPKAESKPAPKVQSKPAPKPEPKPAPKSKTQQIYKAPTSTKQSKAQQAYSRAKPTPKPKPKPAPKPKTNVFKSVAKRISNIFRRR